MKTNILVHNKTKLVALDKATQRELLEAKSNTLVTIKKWEDRVVSGRTAGEAIGVLVTMKNHLSSIVVEIASRVGKKSKA